MLLKTLVLLVLMTTQVLAASSSYRHLADVLLFEAVLRLASVEVKLAVHLLCLHPLITVQDIPNDTRVLSYKLAAMCEPMMLLVCCGVSECSVSCVCATQG